MTKKSNSLSKIIWGIILIIVQGVLIIYFSLTNTLYLPDISYLGMAYIVPVAIYYLGYFMIGITGVLLLAFGIAQSVSPIKLKKLSSSKGFSVTTSILFPVGFGIFIFANWQNGVLLKVLNTTEVFLPKPERIWSVFSEMVPKTEWSTAGQFTYYPDMGDHIVSTLKISILGLIFGSVLGYIIAILATVFKRWGKGGLTVVSVFNAIPIVALAPVMLYWTKIMNISSENGFRSMVFKIMVVTLVCTSTMSVNAYRGLNEFKPFSEDLLSTYAAKHITVFLKLRLPNSIPYIFTALKVSLPISVISTLVSEYFGDADVALGVGRMIKENIVNSQFAIAWVYISIACVMGILLYVLLMILQSILLRNRKH
ncbi:MAG: ABC transporter permease [Acutalibacteraceae bacterium]